MLSQLLLCNSNSLFRFQVAVVVAVVVVVVVVAYYDKIGEASMESHSPQIQRAIRVNHIYFANNA